MTAKQRNNTAARVRHRVLIVDDHPIVRFGFTELIGDEPDLVVVGQAANASEAIALIRSERPELALVDLTLGEDSGLELVKQIGAQYPSVRVLVASVHDEQLFAERALRAGAMGYVNKNEAIGGLVAAIRRVLKGRIYLSNAVSDQLIGRATLGEDQQLSEDPYHTLSDRELAIFEHFGRGFTARQIAERLHLSVKTVDTYRSHIKDKLRLENNCQLVVHAARWVVECA